MKIRHKPPSVEGRPSATVDVRYQSEVEQACARADRAYRKALRFAEKAERETRRHAADLVSRQKLREAQRDAEAKWLELKSYEAQARRGSVSGCRRSGSGSVSRLGNWGSL